MTLSAAVLRVILRKPFAFVNSRPARSWSSDFARRHGEALQVDVAIPKPIERKTHRYDPSHIRIHSGELDPVIGD